MHGEMESLQKFLLWKDMIRRVSGETGIVKLCHPGSAGLLVHVRAGHSSLSYISYIPLITHLASHSAHSAASHIALCTLCSITQHTLLTLQHHASHFAICQASTRPRRPVIIADFSLLHHLASSKRFNLLLIFIYVHSTRG